MSQVTTFSLFCPLKRNRSKRSQIVQVCSLNDSFPSPQSLFFFSPSICLISSVHLVLVFQKVQCNENLNIVNLQRCDVSFFRASCCFSPCSPPRLLECRRARVAGRKQRTEASAGGEQPDCAGATQLARSEKRSKGFPHFGNPLWSSRLLSKSRGVHVR